MSESFYKSLLKIKKLCRGLILQISIKNAIFYKKNAFFYNLSHELKQCAILMKNSPTTRGKEELGRNIVLKFR